MDLDTFSPGDRLELQDGSIVRVVQHSPDGEHLPVVYVRSRSDVFSGGEETLVYAHEVVRRVEESEASESKFAYSEGEEVMYRDEHGNQMTPEEFRAHLARPETEEERESRYRYARETQRRLLGDDAPPEAFESHENGSHGPSGSA